jgi:hypothetical protein
VQQQTLGRRGHRDDPLYRARRDLRRGLAHITDRQWARLELALVVGDPSGQLTDTWMAAQELQLLYARSHDLADAKRRLWRILDRCARSQVPELHRLARTLDSWRDELLAYWTAHRPTRREQRSDRSHQRPDQEDQARRTRLPQPRQLPPAAAAHRRSGLEHRPLAGSACHPDPRPLTTLGGVEPDKHQGQRRSADVSPPVPAASPPRRRAATTAIRVVLVTSEYVDHMRLTVAADVTRVNGNRPPLSRRVGLVSLALPAGPSG